MLYAVTKVNVFGSAQPVFFKSFADAAFYKRATAIVEACRSNYFDRFEDEYGTTCSSLLSALCKKLMKSIYKFERYDFNKEEFEFNKEEREIYKKFNVFLKTQKNCNFRQLGDFITFSDDTFIGVQIWTIDDIEFKK